MNFDNTKKIKCKIGDLGISMDTQFVLEGTLKSTIHPKVDKEIAQQIMMQAVDRFQVQNNERLLSKIFGLILQKEKKLNFSGNQKFQNKIHNRHLLRRLMNIKCLILNLVQYQVQKHLCRKQIKQTYKKMNYKIKNFRFLTREANGTQELHFQKLRNCHIKTYIKQLRAYQ